MSKFHSKDGLYFQRRDDGSVDISHWLSGIANTGRADQQPCDVLNRSWRLTASEWASVVASVSQDGENGETWKAALDFHGEPKS